MRCLNNRFIIEPAAASDNQALLELLEQSSFEGDISLLYTRRPDAYASLLSEGREMEVSLCRDTSNNTVVAMGVYVIQDLYINGISERVSYIFGLRSLQDSLRRHPLLPRFYEYLAENLKAKGIKICYTTILKDNASTQKLLEKRRTFMPEYNYFGNFETFSIRPIRKEVRNGKYVFSKAALEDITDAAAFLNREGKGFQFYPALTSEDIISETCRGIGSDNFYMVKQGNEIVAAGAVWDQGDYKQYIVQNYSGRLNFLKTLPFIGRMLRLPVLPDPGQRLKFCTLARWAVKSNRPEIFNFFLDNILAQVRDYSFCAVGIHESHPLRDQLISRSHIKYDSKVYLVHWDHQNQDLLRKDLPVYLECGAL